jgi:outer membrane protein, multidrug efflux system
MMHINVSKNVMALSLVLAIASSACTVGPKYVKPEAPLPTQFDQALGVQSDQLAPIRGEAPAAQSLLWASFNDDGLNALLARAKQENKTIAQAQARLRETRALRGLSFFSLFPTVTAGTDAERSKTSNLDPFVPSGTGITETYRAGFDVAWEIDLFGGLRNQKRAIDREEQANEAELQAAHLAMSAEVAQAYFSLRGAEQRLKIQKKNIENLQRADKIYAVRLKEGRGNALELSQNRALALQVMAQVPNTEADIVRQEQRLAVLTAQPVAALRQMAVRDKAMPVLPSLQNVGTPEAWIQRRPDVLIAERRFAAANARIGEKIADYFPKVNLLGGFGWTGQSGSDIGDSAAERWRFGPSISWSFLDFGRVRQNVKAARARADGSAAAYQESVLLALEDTENALAQYRASNQSEQNLKLALEQASKARHLAKLRYDNGASDFLTLLDAERSLLAIEDTHVQARTAQATSLARLYKALGGDFAAAAVEKSK